MIAARLAACLVIATVAVGSSGCATVRLYRKPDHDLAMKVQTTFKEARLRESVVEERKRLDDLLQRELTASRRQVLATRDAQLLAIVGGTTSEQSWGELDRAIDTRLERLVGLSHVKAIVSDYNDLEARRAQIARTIEVYRLARGAADPAPVCPADGTADPSSPIAARAFGVLRQECKDLVVIETRLRGAGAPGTTWQALNARVSAVQAELAIHATELASVRKGYEAARAAYDRAVQGQQSDVEALRKDLLARLDELGKVDTAAGKTAGDTLTKLGFGDLGLAGLAEKLEEQRKALRALLDGKTGASGGTPASRAIAALIPSLEPALTAGKAPPVNALVLEVEHLRLNAEGLGRRIAHANTRLVLLEAKRDAMFGELVWLARSRRSLDAVKAGCQPGKDLAEDVAGRMTGTCKEDALRALVYYANSWALGRVTADRIDYTLIGARHVAALDVSEVALAQWENLIGVPINGLVAYHASGLKPEDIAAFLQALGVIGIAAGVH